MEFVNVNQKGTHKGHYSAGVISGNILYISGQLSMDMETGAVPGADIKEHAKQAFLNLDRVLGKAGAGRQDVIQCRVYIPDVEYWNRVDAVYQDFFGGHMPARVVIPVKKLHYGCMVEIEAVAEVKRKAAPERKRECT